MKIRTVILAIGVTCALTVTVSAPAGAQAQTQVSGQASVQQDQASTWISSASSVSGNSGRLNAGLQSDTALNAVLTSPVDSKKMKAGDAITARTAEAVKANGKTVLPKGTKLLGHVTKACARAKGDTDSSLGMAFDRAILKGGEEGPLRVGIVALASAQSAAAVSEADVDSTPDMGASATGSTKARGRGTLGGVTSAAGSGVGTNQHGREHEWYGAELGSGLGHWRCSGLKRLNRWLEFCRSAYIE